jgi:predicted phage tail protein
MDVAHGTGSFRNSAQRAAYQNICADRITARLQPTTQISAINPLDGLNGLRLADKASASGAMVPHQARKQQSVVRITAGVKLKLEKPTGQALIQYETIRRKKIKVRTPKSSSLAMLMSVDNPRRAPRR